MDSSSLDSTTADNNAGQDFGRNASATDMSAMDYSGSKSPAFRNGAWHSYNQVHPRPSYGGGGRSKSEPWTVLDIITFPFQLLMALIVGAFMYPWVLAIIAIIVIAIINAHSYSNPPMNTASDSIPSLAASDLANKSSFDLDVMRNEPFARHGYRIGRSDLAQYFKQQPWYNPTTSDQDHVWNNLSDTEKHNVELIKKYQRRTGHTRAHR